MRMKVKDHNNLVRDTHNMAILNINASSLAKDALYKEKIKREKEVDSAINKLNSDVSEIKNNLAKIIDILENRGQ